MKKLSLVYLLISIFIISSCSSNEDELAKNTTITLNFTHTWDDDEVTSDDFNVLQFKNENGEILSIERLRYLISDIYVINESDVTTEIADYILVNLGEETNLIFTAENLLLDGTYDFYMRFGFSDEDNYVEDGYEDLTSENFNVGEDLGGGYHYMQFDGKYLNELNVETGFNYHAIRATNITDETGDTQDEILATGIDTSFEIDLGEIEIEDNEVTINIQMDIAEWFVDPNTWDLNTLGQMLMPNYEAQIMMSANGKTTFSLIEEEDEEEE